MINLNNYSEQLNENIDVMVEKLTEKILTSLVEKMKHYTIVVEEETPLVKLSNNERIHDKTFQLVVNGIEQTKNKHFQLLFDEIGQLVAIDFGNDKVLKGETIHIRYIVK